MDNKEIAIKFGAWIAKQTEILDHKHFVFRKSIELHDGNIHNEDILNIESLFEVFVAWEEINLSNEQSEIERLKDGNRSLLKIQDQLLSKIRRLEDTVEFGFSEGTPLQHNKARIRSLEEQIKQFESKLADFPEETYEYKRNELLEKFMAVIPLDDPQFVEDCAERCVKIFETCKLAEQSEWQDIIEFATWYSGMDREKVLVAYTRWLKENGKIKV